SPEAQQLAAEKLMKEATAMSSFNHQNIVSIFDVGQDEEGGYVIMELLEGETLNKVVSRGPLTLEDFHQLATQTLEALIAADELDMLHRDLKPTNIMVIWLPSDKFLVKILDFGLAKVSEQPSLQTIDQSSHSILGSILFMAPEQFELQPLTSRTDLYSIACVYYYCLTGKQPFDGTSMAEVMMAHLEHRVTSLQELRPDLPLPLCQWVMWLLNRQVEHRPENAQEALDRLPLVESDTGKILTTNPSQPIPIFPDPATGPRPILRTSTSPQNLPPSSASVRVPAQRMPSTTRPVTTKAPLPDTSSPPSRFIPILLGAGLVISLLALGLTFTLRPPIPKLNEVAKGIPPSGFLASDLLYDSRITRDLTLEPFVAQSVRKAAFFVSFTPAPVDLKGTTLLMEIGGESNGSGIFLVEGLPTFAAKMGSKAPNGHGDALLDLSLSSGGDPGTLSAPFSAIATPDVLNHLLVVFDIGQSSLELTQWIDGKATQDVHSVDIKAHKNWFGRRDVALEFPDRKKGTVGAAAQKPGTHFSRSAVHSLTTGDQTAFLWIEVTDPE
ncbi:MAG: protein kinase, partial [Verrucomicrobiota bacterium]